jgi:hypothetical protein
VDSGLLDMFHNAAKEKFMAIIESIYIELDGRI